MSKSYANRLLRQNLPRYQSTIGDLPNSGTKILVADAGDLAEYFEHEILSGETCDDASALASNRRLKQIRSESGGELVHFHDPNHVIGSRLAPAFYD